MKDIYKIAEALANECYEGTSHLDICRYIGGIDPIIQSHAPTFFQQSYFAHLYAAQMYAAKVFDTHPNAITIPRFLRHCCAKKDKFKNATPEQVLATVYQAGQTIMAMDDAIAILKKRRDYFLAHVSHTLVFNRDRLRAGPQLEFGQIRNVLSKGGRIVNELSAMWCGIANPIHNSNADDYKVVVKMMYKQICADIDKQEAEAAKFNYPLKIPRPKPPL